MPVSIFADITVGKGVYVSRKVENKDQFIQWAKDQGYTEINEDLHVTISYSRKYYDPEFSDIKQVEVLPEQFGKIDILGDGTVLFFDNTQLKKDWQDKIDQGATWDYPDFIPHITISYNHQGSMGELPNFPVVLGEEIGDELNFDYVEEATTASVFTK